MYTPVNLFYYIKVRCKRYTSHWTCYPDVFCLFSDICFDICVMMSMTLTGCGKEIAMLKITTAGKYKQWLDHSTNIYSRSCFCFSTNVAPYEPHYKKICLQVSDQVRHKQGCTNTEALNFRYYEVE